MSLRIEIDRVEGVLLADGWRTVADESFEIDASSEFFADEELVGNVDGAWVRFMDDERQEICAPFAAVRAVCLRPDE
jgi:hypothetical protein